VPPDAAEPPGMPTGFSGDDRYGEAIEFLYGLINYEKLAGPREKYRFRLDRMRELLRRLELGDLLHSPDRPDHRPPIPTIHLAGTKGKGSTATMIAAMLSAAGIRTGLYTSPHVHDLEERFRVDGVACPRRELIQWVDRMRPICAAMADVGCPSFFELTTAIALAHFRSARCDVQVLEVGLGGRLDSTNVVQPTLTLITSIGLDHQMVLGDTLAEIAGEKAGILKPGVPVISGVRHTDGSPVGEDAAGVIRRVAERTGAPMREIGRDFELRCRPRPDWGSRVTIIGPQGNVGQNGTAELTFDLAAEGTHQAINAALAVEAIGRLGPIGGRPIDRTKAVAALAELDLMGRIERVELADGQTAIIDTAHNEDSIGALTQAMLRRYGPNSETPRRIVIVFGTSRDKDSRVMLRLLAALSDRIVLTRFHGNPRYLDVDELKRQVDARVFSLIRTEDRPLGALATARGLAGPGGVIVVCGSFFLADETRQSLLDDAVDRRPDETLL